MAYPILIIDDNDFSPYVDFVSLKRKAHFFDKYANRDINGDLHREIIGVYINFSLEIGIIDDFNKYNELWEKLTEKKEFHKIRISSNSHNYYEQYCNAYEFIAYLADIEDEGFLIRDDKNTFKGLKVEFIAKSPHRVEYNYHNRHS